MDIVKYTDYFHDGYVNSVSHTLNNISFSLESAVIEDIDQMEDKKYFSEANTLKGTLNLYNIKNFTLSGKNYEHLFEMEYDDGDILDFQINGNKVFLLIEWKNFPPKSRKTDVSKIEIEAEKIEWVPDLSSK
jgi:hypothetical protein